MVDPSLTIESPRNERGVERWANKPPTRCKQDNRLKHFIYNQPQRQPRRAGQLQGGLVERIVGRVDVEQVSVARQKTGRVLINAYGTAATLA